MNLFKLDSWEANSWDLDTEDWIQRCIEASEELVASDFNNGGAFAFPDPIIDWNSASRHW